MTMWKGILASAACFALLLPASLSLAKGGPPASNQPGNASWLPPSSPARGGRATGTMKILLCTPGGECRVRKIAHMPKVAHHCRFDGGLPVFVGEGSKEPRYDRCQMPK